jgi:hypothetical protein
MLKTCSACRATAERKDLHKNRYGEYLCRECQAAGIKLTGRQRLRNLIAKIKKHERQAWLIVIRLGMLALALWLLFKMLASVDS